MSVDAHFTASWPWRLIVDRLWVCIEEPNTDGSLLWFRWSAALRSPTRNTSTRYSNCTTMIARVATFLPLITTRDNRHQHRQSALHPQRWELYLFTFKSSSLGEAFRDSTQMLKMTCFFRLPIPSEETWIPEPMPASENIMNPDTHIHNIVIW
jgi:hypothetical protein